MIATDKAPRIWGEWEPAFYGSGTTLVRLKGAERKPWLYIYSDSAIDEDRWMRDRYQMCYDLTAFMNGGARPAWLSDFERTGETQVVSLSGGSITATGPMVDADPPNLNWQQDDSEDAKSDRARLMDAMFLGVQ